VLLAGWAAARPPGVTSWLSCDRADADPVRFWAGFIEAPRAIDPGFGADAADLLAMDRTMSADVTASVANDAARLPSGSAIVVDDFHYAAAAAAPDMTDLVERWPAETVQPGARRPLTAAEQRVLTLLPTSTYLQIADTLYISRNTVKSHLRSIYQKLGVASRLEALERAVDLRLL
jgi:ATP/maltotriose-dependent transcriptional regulator MalT